MIASVDDILADAAFAAILSSFVLPFPFVVSFRRHGLNQSNHGGDYIVAVVYSVSSLCPSGEPSDASRSVGPDARSEHPGDVAVVVGEFVGDDNRKVSSDGHRDCRPRRDGADEIFHIVEAEQ